MKTLRQPVWNDLHYMEEKTNPVLKDFELESKECRSAKIL